MFMILLLPLGVVGLAMWVDSRRKDSSAPDERMGAVPIALAAGAGAELSAGEIAILVGLADVVPVVGAMGVLGYLAYRLWTDDYWKADDKSLAWASPSSPPYVDATGGIASALSAAGLKIDPKCAWSLSPQTFYQKILQNAVKAFEDVSDVEPAKIALARAGMKIEDVMTAAAGNALRKLEAEEGAVWGEGVAERLFGLRPAFEVGFLLLETMNWISSIDDGVLVPVLFEAIRRTIDQAWKCWNGLRETWPAGIARKFAGWLSLVERTFKVLKMLRMPASMGARFVTEGGKIVTSALLGALIEKEMTTGIPMADTFIKNALDWVTLATTTKELPPEVTKEKPGQMARSFVLRYRPEDLATWDIVAENTSMPGVELAPPQGKNEVEVPWGGYRFWIKHRGTEESYRRNIGNDIPFGLWTGDGGEDYAPTYVLEMTDDTHATVSVVYGTSKKTEKNTMVVTWPTAATNERLPEPGPVAPGTKGSENRPTTFHVVGEDLFVRMVSPLGVAAYEGDMISPGSYAVEVRVGDDWKSIGSMDVAPGTTYRVESRDGQITVTPS